MCRTIESLGLQIYFQSVVLEMKPRVVGASLGSQYRSICRTGSQCRGCNSTSSLVIMFGALEMKNRVVGSQIRAIGIQYRAIYRAESQCRARGCMSSGALSSVPPLLKYHSFLCRLQKSVSPNIVP